MTYKRRYCVLVRGRVQGVGFRWSVMNCARRYGITGTVENMRDWEEVEIHCQGDLRSLSAFLNEIKTVDPYADVRDMKISEENVDERERDFTVRNDW